MESNLRALCGLLLLLLVASPTRTRNPWNERAYLPPPLLLLLLLHLLARLRSFRRLRVIVIFFLFLFLVLLPFWEGYFWGLQQQHPPKTPGRYVGPSVCPAREEGGRRAISIVRCVCARPVSLLLQKSLQKVKAREVSFRALKLEYTFQQPPQHHHPNRGRKGARRARNIPNPFPLACTRAAVAIFQIVLPELLHLD